MQAQLAVELGRDSGPSQSGEYLSHSTAVTLGRVLRQEAEQQTQASWGLPWCYGSEGTLGRGPQPLGSSAVCHGPTVTDCAGPWFSDGCSKGVSLLSLFKENREFKKPAWFELGLQGICNSHSFSVLPSTKISISLL